jgi:predicted nicotinamide N-methyase
MRRVLATSDAGALELIRDHTRVQPAPLVPEVKLHLADRLVPLWQATEWRAASPQEPPFWAFAWPGSVALARYLLDSPGLVRGQRVLDFGSGGGLAAIAAAMSEASDVRANDIDPLAALVQSLNAELNDVTFESTWTDLVDTRREADTDLILAGDVCYERESAERVTAWLRLHASLGVLVLLADPGRHYVPADGLEVLATYDVPTLHELESIPHKRTHVWRVLAG